MILFNLFQCIELYSLAIYNMGMPIMNMVVNNCKNTLTTNSCFVVGKVSTFLLFEAISWSRKNIYIITMSRLEEGQTKFKIVVHYATKMENPLELELSHGRKIFYPLSRVKVSWPRLKELLMYKEETNFISSLPYHLSLCLGYDLKYCLSTHY